MRSIWRIRQKNRWSANWRQLTHTIFILFELSGISGYYPYLGAELSEPLLTLEAMELDFSNEGGIGNTYQLLKNIMGLWIVQECKRECDEQGGGT